MIYTGGVSWRTFRFARPDGRNAIGFAPRIAGALGAANISTWSTRPRRTCRWTSTGRRCHATGAGIGRRIVERDTAIDPYAPWQSGPAYPGSEEYDLETVLIHELGHWSGNDHARRCAASPMVRALEHGRWSAARSTPASLTAAWRRRRLRAAAAVCATFITASPSGFPSASPHGQRWHRGDGVGAQGAARQQAVTTRRSFRCGTTSQVAVATRMTQWDSVPKRLLRSSVPTVHPQLRDR